MTLVTELDLPSIDLTSAELAGDRYHRLLAELRGQGWLASSPLAFLVLDREAGEFFLRARETAFPGREIADLFGVTAGPLRTQIDANILNQRGERHRRLRALVRRFRRRAGQALPVADHRGRARRPGPGRAAAARVVEPGAAAVRYPGPGQRGAADRARGRRAAGLRRGAAGAAAGRAGR